MATELSRVFVPFAEVRKSTVKGPDGKDLEVRMVQGFMTDETLDLDKQIVDYDWAKGASDKWFKSWANIREQHTSSAVGKGVYLSALDEQRAMDLTSRVVDPLSVMKIDEGILQGYSVGIKGARVAKDAKAPNGRIVGGEIVEVSLVDHPANENCKVVLAKAARSGRLEPVDQEFVEKALSPLIGNLVADLDGGLNKPGTEPAGPQAAAEAASGTGTQLDVTPESAIGPRKKKQPLKNSATPRTAANTAPKGASPDDAGGPHAHLHTHDAGTDQEYVHAHGHGHDEGLHAEGKKGDHQHDHVGKSVKADITKGSIIAGQALAGQDGPGPNANVTAPSGANAGVCGNGSCSCGDCGPACTGSCCTDCTMGANTSSDRIDQQATEAQRGWKGVSADQSNSEEEIEDMYAKAAPELKSLLEAGDIKAALVLMAETELAIAKGSIIDAQPNATDDGDVAETTPDSAKPRKRVKPEAGGLGQGNRAPESEDVAPTKAVVPDSMKAFISEVSKAVETALKPLRERIETMEKRAAPGGPMLNGSKLLSAPDDVRAAALKARVGDVDIATVRDWAENHPDGTVRMGMKQILADIEK
ncbi:MAG TPA: hypothetical protein VGU71_22310 [Candidatus Dormibacteraeota bacterium]|nr:hypothetical protein [Candidatus Dormibacteraeota bacterium]